MLLLIRKVNAAPVLRSHFVTLPILSGGVNPVPQNREELLLRHGLRVEHYFHSLGVASVAAADFLVRNCFAVSVHVSRKGINDAWNALKAEFNAPEAPSANTATSVWLVDTLDTRFLRTSVALGPNPFPGPLPMAVYK